MKKQVIHKFEFPFVVDGDVKIVMPRNATILDIQNQRRDLTPDRIVLWALVDPNEVKVNHKFKLVMTGEQVTSDVIDYLGTVQLHDNELVVHIFDMGEGSYVS